MTGFLPKFPCFEAWKVDVRKHTILRNRYIEWMQKLGYPKFEANAEQSVNFQLFPPHSGTEENFARHGNGRANGFSKLQIPLEDGVGSNLIFRADEIDGKIIEFDYVITFLNPNIPPSSSK